MTKVLYVSSEGDYGAMIFADNGYGVSVEVAYRLAMENGGRYEMETEDDYLYFDAYEFGDIDPKFIRFLRNNIIDYDRSKAHDFFIVEDES